MSNNVEDGIPTWLHELCVRLQSDDNKAMLTEVNLNIRRLNYSMMVHFCNVLLRDDCSALKSLNLTSSLIDRADMPSTQVIDPLVRGVLSSTMCSLQILHLSYNRLTGPLRGLGKSLSVNQTLTELFLDHNRIDCETAIDLSEGLRMNQSLQVLQLSSNLIGDRGATHLAGALVPNKSLRSLGLSRNFIGQEGGSAFMDTLWKHKNTTLTVLDLQNNPSISAATLGWLTTLCQANGLGRRILLFQSDSLPGIVAPLLAKACSQSPSALFVFLQEVHSIVPPPSPSSSSTHAAPPIAEMDLPPSKKACH